MFVCFLGAGAGAGALFGSFWGPGVVIWIPFWVIWGPFWVSISGLICSLYVVICVFFEDFGYGKTSKSRRIASTNGGSLSILPPSVLAIRGDLLVFRIQNLQETRKSARKASKYGEHLFG